MIVVSHWPSQGTGYPLQLDNVRSRVDSLELTDVSIYTVPGKYVLAQMIQRRSYSTCHSIRKATHAWIVGHPPGETVAGNCPGGAWNSRGCGTVSIE